MSQCSQEKCDKPATVSYVWPGRPERLYACNACYERALTIATAMGFVLGDVRAEDDGRPGPGHELE